jgi:hypothetical protein
LLEVYYTIVEQ